MRRELWTRRLRILKTRFMNRMIWLPEDIHSYPAKLRVKLISVQHAADSADAGPTRQEYEAFRMLDREVSEQLSRWKTLAGKDVPTFEKKDDAGSGH